ncbi:nagb/rpia/CoA transferase-like protein [Cryphonectria parasitica EP155]|uniref:5-formyltetrahydrofolate cyclo-ligase n=1 Tax=Cryphonectria parasitica (strain ATCC 38755 / EP155) TaxID=660469 RepID=A0A9P4Y766_CRYP1|nr:nagb/rpia/CoA transferase-like protein [Cryphonectria parasitica EP155]KAF3767622.1 nagb/rpia/CoA transferase-like protein [Cryphonectria parasitica EP155]
MNAALFAAKQQLRSAMKQRLASLPQESIKEQSHTIHKALLGFKPYVDASRISVFLSMPSAEVQTDEVVRHALASGKHVFVPYLHKSPLPSNPDIPSRVMDMVRLKDVRDYESLKRDKWGIPSIDPATVHQRQRILGGPDEHQSEKATLDLILMPGVAFDIAPHSNEIRRMGHGRGFYDLFLERYAEKLEELDVKRPSVSLYGLGLREQFLTSENEEVPVGPLDQPLHGLILGDGKTVVPDQID